MSACSIKLIVSGQGHTSDIGQTAINDDEWTGIVDGLNRNFVRLSRPNNECD
ncbi:hypothetical protein [Alteromonas sp. A079]|uniref:hypothetical protein n=1 Tax=Alteromonas sp. A079 TaxID=3410268 RepID=UPI003BA3D5EB